MQALLRYPRRLRRAKAREWAYRSHAAQSAARLERGPDADTLYRRALDDRRGTVIREGVLYRGDGRAQSWQVRHSIDGRVDQYDVVLDGALWRTGGRRMLAQWLPGLRVL